MFDFFKWQDLLVILAIALIFFGPAKLPEIGKAIGRSIKGFKEGINNVTVEVKKEIGEIKDSTSNLKNDNTNTINKVN